MYLTFARACSRFASAAITAETTACFAEAPPFLLASGFAITALDTFSAASLYYTMATSEHIPGHVLHHTCYHSESEASHLHPRNSGCPASKEHQN